MLLTLALRKKSPYSELFWSAFSRIFLHSDWIRRDTEYLSVFSPNAGKCGSISPYSVRMRENAGKMSTRITPKLPIRTIFTHWNQKIWLNFRFEEKEKFNFWIIIINEVLEGLFLKILNLLSPSFIFGFI